MSSNDTHATDITTTTPAPPLDTGEAFPGLPNHLVTRHILRSEYFDDPADLAWLPAVSRGMRDTMAGTGFQDEKLNAKRAVDLGCVSALQCLQPCRVENSFVRKRREVDI